MCGDLAARQEPKDTHRILECSLLRGWRYLRLLLPLATATGLSGSDDVDGLGGGMSPEGGETSSGTDPSGEKVVPGKALSNIVSAASACATIPEIRVSFARPSFAAE